MKSLPTKAFAPCADACSLPSHGIRITHTRLSSTECSGGFDAEWEDSITERMARRLASRSPGKPLTKAGLRTWDEVNGVADGGCRKNDFRGLPIRVAWMVGRLRRLVSGPEHHGRGKHRRPTAKRTESLVGRGAELIGATGDLIGDPERTEVEAGHADQAGKDRERVAGTGYLEPRKNRQVIAWLDSLPEPGNMAGPHECDEE